MDIDKDKLTNEFEVSLQTFINICKARKITPVLMTQASRFRDDPDEVVKRAVEVLKIEFGISYKDRKEMHDLFNESIRAVGLRNNVLVIDLARKVPQEKEYIYDVAHYNDTGCKFVSKIISNELLKILH